MFIDILEIKKAQDLLKEREAAGNQPKPPKRGKYKSEAIAISSDESSEEE
jgi:hypothetical protein